MDLKYITITQVLEILYEGRLRRFSVVSISQNSQSQKGSLTHKIEALSLESKPQLWTVNWDSKISIVENDAPISKKVDFT